MANIQSISHKKSAVVENGAPKLPTISQLELGELAINFADGYETLSIKNNNDEIVTFTNDLYWKDKELVIAAALNDLKQNKQDVLVYDEVPTEGSGNPVTSGGLYNYITEIEQGTAAALNDLNGRILTEDTPTENSTKLVTSGGLYTYITNIEEVVSEALNDLNDRKQDILDIDNTPTQYSNNPISSNAAFEMSKVTAAALNDLNERKANTSDVQQMIQDYGLNNLAPVATSGSYNDLTNKPSLASVATSGSYNDLSNKPNLTVTQIATTGTQIANVMGTTLYAPDATVTLVLNTGTEIAQVGSTSIYAPDNTIYEVNHGTSDTTFTLTPNTMHIWGEVASLNLSLPQDTNTALDEYLFTFTCPAAAPTTLVLPADVKWVQQPNLQEGKTYQVSIMNGLAGYLTDDMETSGDENIIEEIKLNGTALPITDKSVNVNAVTSITVNSNNYTPDATGLIDLGTIGGGTETDPIFSASPAAGITAANITDWNSKVSNVQADWNATSGLAQILNKPTIPAAVTESTVSGWGFTKNTGTVTGVKINGTTKNPTSGVVDLGTVLTSFTETDPTVPAWAKAASKPTYTAAEVGALPDTYTPPVTSVNGQTGAVNLTIPAAPGTLNTTATTAQSTSSSEALSGNITLHKVAKTGTYNDLIGKPTIPAAVTESTVSGWGFTKNAGTITGITMNGTSKGTSGVIDLGTVLTSHQDISGKADKSAAIGSLSLSMDSNTYKITLSGTKVDGTIFTVADVIDLPLESVVVSGAYDNTTKKVVLTLKDGSTVDFSVADLVNGLQTEITSTNKLSADLIANGTTNKVVTAAEKTAWNNKSNFSGNYNDLTNKPTIPAAPGTLNTNNATAQTVSASEALSGTINLHKVAKTGSYNDLLNKPTIPTALADLTADATHRLVTDTEKSTWNNKASSDTKNTAGATQVTLGSEEKLYLVGAKAQGNNPLTYTDSNIYLTVPNGALHAGGISANTINAVSGNFGNTTTDTVKLSGSDFSGIKYGAPAITLLSVLDSKASDSNVVHLAGLETITGNKIIQDTLYFSNPDNSCYIKYYDTSPEVNNQNLLLSANDTVYIDSDTRVQGDLTVNSGNSDLVITENGITTSVTTNKSNNKVWNTNGGITDLPSLSKGTTTGSGNAVTDISVSGHTVTLTKGTTFLTSHQDISGKANDADVVHKTGNETISGNKTFQGLILVNTSDNYIEDSGGYLIINSDTGVQVTGNGFETFGCGIYSDGQIEAPTIKCTDIGNRASNKFFATDGTIQTLPTGSGGEEKTSNKVTSISSSSTNTQYPSALAVYNFGTNLVSQLTKIYSGSGAPASSLGNNGDIYIKVT